MKIFNLNKKKIGLPDFLLLIVAGLSVASVSCWHLIHMRSGIDFSDEGFYLNSISNPYLYKASVTLFGFIYHPIFLLADGNIVWIRAMNFLITGLISFAFGWVVIRPEVKSKLISFLMILMISTSTLVLQDYRSSTPSYNTLALQALMISAIGYVLIIKFKNQNFLGYAILAIGGVMVFLAKPTTALGLAIITTLSLIISKKIKLKQSILAIGIALVLMFFTAIMIDGSVHGFYSRMNSGYEDTIKMGGNYGLLKSFSAGKLDLSFTEKTYIIISSFLVFLSATFFEFGLFLSFFVLLAIVSVFIGYNFYYPFFSRLIAMQIISCPIGLLLYCGKYFSKKRTLTINHELISIALLFLSMPLIYAFGTNRNIWLNAEAALIFWILGTVYIFLKVESAESNWKKLTPSLILVQFFVTICINTGIQWPVRQDQPLNLNNKNLSFSHNNSKLLVSEDVSRFLNEINNNLVQNGYHNGQSMIDFTGRYPGVLYLIGAKATGLPWMIGGYPGSNLLAKSALDRLEKKEISNSWLLVESNGKRSISTSILENYGLDINKNYEKTGSVTTPNGEFPAGYTLYIFKPRLNSLN